ncbi:Telomerase Cajal body protein 1 [Frankliniella fusca]|uniref:WD repeat-containing protein 79 n=1 Tax=Frankliniella fusca TaxID=407009 RepID=A0AAE1LC21_9NEOP|nr:Telomerase Cajal body protein 1 [Frankliniella fusca]
METGPEVPLNDPPQELQISPISTKDNSQIQEETSGVSKVESDLCQDEELGEQDSLKDFASTEVISVGYQYFNCDEKSNSNREPILTFQDFSEFKTDECFTKGCKWAPDGLCFLTNSNDNKLRVWDLPQIFHSSKEWDKKTDISSLHPSLSMKEGGLIYDFCWYPLMNSWNPVTCCLASASRDSPVHLWDAFSGELRATYRAYNQVDEVEAARSIAFDCAGEKLYCGFKNCVKIFDVSLPGRQCTASGDIQNGIVSCIAVSPAIQSLFAVGTYMRTIGLYMENTGKALCILQGHEGGITHMKFSEDGLRLLSGGRKDSEILCWDLREPGKILFSVPRPVMTHQRIYFDLTADGKYLLSGTSDGMVHVWDTSAALYEEGNLKETVKAFKAHKDCTNGISIHQHYPLLVTCSGQRHYMERSDSEDETEKGAESYNSIENSIKLWWLGNEKLNDVMED